MLHLGDITKISGYTAPITDCVVGGSPCQDLSIAGKRAGLDGERSGLFMEQIRIIKEMRDRDVRENGRTGVDVRPRYMVWENVPGAFSSNKGEDFRIVLEETAKVADKDAHVPMPDNGKWQTSGCILGDGWSIAWRVLDAQFWGVPQRRRRIALVADFGGHSAPQILFVSKGVSGHPQPSQPQGKATAKDATRGTGADDIYCIDGDKLNKKERNGGSGIGYREGNQYTLTAKDVHGVAYDSAAYTMKIRSGCEVDVHGKSAGKGALIQTEKSGTISCVQDQYLFQPVFSVENHPADSRVDIDDSGKVQTLTSRMGTGGGNVPMVMEAYQHHGYRESGICGTLTAGQNGSVRGDTNLVVEPTVFSKSKRAQSATDYETWQESDTANTLNTFDQGDVRTNECVIALDRASYNQGKNAQFDIGIDEKGTAQSLVAKGPGAVCYSVDQGGGKSACSVTEGQAPTLTCTHGGEPAVCYSLDPLSSNSMKSSNPHSGCHETDVARTIDTTNPDPSKNQGGVAIVEACGFDPSASRDVGQYVHDDMANTLTNGSCPGYHNGVAVMTMQAIGEYKQSEVGSSVKQRDYKDATDLVCAVDCRNGTEDEMNGALQSMASNNINSNNVVRTRYTVRRLTPLECERLQGYPDGWTDIGEYIDSNGKKKQSSDAARYKALGNSIALPQWKWVMKRLCACYERDATLASLFSGIGGFDLIWTQLNGYGSVLWEAEIEDFPSAVCKRHFGDEATGERGDFYEALLGRDTKTDVGECQA